MCTAGASAGGLGLKMHVRCSAHACTLWLCALGALVMTIVLIGNTCAQLARLLAASCGEEEVTGQRWAEMRALERVRLERTCIHVTAVIAG